MKIDVRYAGLALLIFIVNQNTNIISYIYIYQDFRQ
jgi:hypothetical protein